MTTQDDRAKAARERRSRSYIDRRLRARDACLGSSRDVWGMWTTDPGGENGPGRRRAGRFVQSGRTSFFPVPVLRTSTSGRTVSFLVKPSPKPTEPDTSPRDTLTRATLPAAPRPPPQALRAHHSDRSTPLSVSLRLPLSHSFSPSGWSGECIAASAALSTRRLLLVVESYPPDLAILRRYIPV